MSPVAVALLALALLQFVLVATAEGHAGIESIGDDENEWQDGDATTRKDEAMAIGSMISPLRLSWTSLALVLCLLLLIAVHAFLSWMSEMV